MQNSFCVEVDPGASECLQLLGFDWSYAWDEVGQVVSFTHLKYLIFTDTTITFDGITGLRILGSEHVSRTGCPLLSIKDAMQVIQEEATVAEVILERASVKVDLTSWDEPAVVYPKKKIVLPGGRILTDGDIDCLFTAYQGEGDASLDSES